VVADIHLMKHHRNAILGRKLGNSEVSVLLQHVEYNKRLDINIAEGIRDAITEASSTTRETIIISFNLNFRNSEGGNKVFAYPVTTATLPSRLNFLRVLET
jgi:hypothetical protein